MLFSVIIPAYNVKDYLQFCVNSVMNTKFDDYEIIIIDDGSTDNATPALCDKIAEEHPELIRVIHQENRGLGGARNTGTAAAKGDYLFFVDSDDTVVPDTLEILAKIIKEHPCDIIAFNLYTDDGKGTRTPLNSNFIHLDKPFKLSEHPEFLNSLPNAWSRVWKRSLYTDNGIEYPERAWYEDIRTTSKLFAVADSIFTVKDHLYVYLQRDGSIMRSSNVERNVEIIDAFNDFIGWYKEKGLYNEYKDILCELAILNVLVAASVRVLMIDTKHPLLTKFREYMEANFPDFKNPKHIKKLPKMKRLAYRLVIKKRYRLLKLLFTFKG